MIVAHKDRLQPAALCCVNVAVTNFLPAALVKAILNSAIRSPADFALGLGAFGLLMFWKRPPWIVVLLSAAGGELLSRV